MKLRYFQGVWVTGVAISTLYPWKKQTHVYAENSENSPEEPIQKKKQKSCIIVVGTTGMYYIVQV